jgi:hypothetical protein
LRQHELKKFRQYQFFNNITFAAPEATVFSKDIKQLLNRFWNVKPSFVEHHFHYLDDLRYLQLLGVMSYSSAQDGG